MARTKIHTTKKLEKVITKLISTDPIGVDGKLGKWNATIFNVKRKKCWLITNGFTKYNFIITDLKALNLAKLDTVFKNSLFEQLVYDGIIVDFEYLTEIVGRLDLLPTDNDRRTTGFQNQRLYELDYWINEFGNLDNMPINDLANRMNSSAIHVGDSRKMADYTTSIDEITRLLK